MRPPTAPATHGRPVALRRRLVLVVVVVLLAAVAALTVASTVALRAQLTGRLDQELTQASDRLGAPPRVDGDGPPVAEDGSAAPVPPAGEDPADLTEDASAFRDIAPWLGQNAGTVVMVYDGATVDRAGYLTQEGEFAELTTAQVTALQSVPDDGVPHDVTVPGLGTHRAIVGTTGDGETSVVALSTATVTQTLARYVAVEAAIGAAGVAVAALAGTWLVRRSLRPLDTVAAAAGRVSELELSSGAVDAIPRVPPAYTDERTEVGQVGAALNRLLDNVETSLAARHESETQVRRFVADASHELRTPLASIRGYAELVRRSPDLTSGLVPADTLRALDRIESEAGRMSALVEDLLLLARLDAGRPLERAPVDLVALAVDAVSDAHAAGPGHRWELDLPGDPDDDASVADGAADDRTADDGVVEVRGDEARLRQVLVNLLGNARVHTPPGTRVVTGLRVERGDSGARPVAVLTVADDGPGIPPTQRAALFQRFTRGDDARSRTGGSTGLGLAIVKGIVAAHGGVVHVASVTAGEAGAGGAPGASSGTGTVFEVRLPLWRADDAGSSPEGRPRA